MARTDLAAAASELGTAASAARDWVRDLRDRVPRIDTAAPALIEATRGTENLARKLARAAGRRVAVGVFGPSQAGKSYLVSALARRPGTRLEALFADRRLDFLTEINPIGGGKEATGLVTRFTVAGPSVEASHPVALRLLSEPDLVKILANSFFSDFDQNTRTLRLLDGEEMRQRLDRLATLATDPPARHLDEVTLYDLGAYFRDRFQAQIDPLDRVGYWTRLIDLAGRLPLDRRVELYALLWGGEPSFTQFLKRLLVGLATLGFAADARAGLDALIPTPRSIIDVDRLNDLRAGDASADPVALRATGADGRLRDSTLDRAILAALVAELTITLPNAPWPFMADVDLLDFPGARSREKNTAMPADRGEADALMCRLFLRGKVAYLFQRFTEDREMTSMLLCMPQHKQIDVTDLGQMVTDWVHLTHGRGPADRARVPNALFLVLTIHDFNFQRQAVETEEARREWWSGRFKITAREHYGRFDWLDDWDGRPFRDCFFLRNPNHPQEHLVTYRPNDTGEGLVEDRLNDQALERVGALRAAFLADTSVTRHFADPTGAWEAALALNDGGVGLLVARLSAVLDPDLQRIQVGERLRDAAEGLRRRLAEYWYEEGDSARRAAEEKLRQVRANLARPLFQASRWGRFADLLAALQIGEDDVRAVWERVATLRIEAEPAAPAAGAADPWDDPWAAEPTAPVARVVEPEDRARRFARDVVQTWATRLRRASQDARLVAYLGVNAVTIDAVAAEIETAAVRLDLVGEIARAIRERIQAANVRWDDAPVTDRATQIALTLINDHVAFLGAAGTATPLAFPEPPRPAARTIFAPAPVLEGAHALPELGAARLLTERTVIEDWGVAFLQAGLDNLSRPDARDISEADNRRLGLIVAQVARAGA